MVSFFSKNYFYHNWRAFSLDKSPFLYSTRRLGNDGNPFYQVNRMNIGAIDRLREWEEYKIHERGGLMKKIIRLRYLFLLLVIFHTVISSVVKATDYYVSPHGDNMNTGTSPENSWQTISRVNAATFSPGDRLYFEGGYRHYGSLYFDYSDSGTATNPVTVSSYGTGRATIDAGTENGLYAYNCAGIDIRNINFSGSGPTTNTGSGIFFYMDLGGAVKLRRIYINRVDVSGFGEQGISIGSWHVSRSGFRNVRITRTRVFNNQLNGLNIWGYSPSTTAWSHQRVYVSNCKFFDNSGDPDKRDTHSGSGAMIGNSNGVRIQYCEAYNNGWLCNYPGGGPVGIWVWDSNNAVIQCNESHHNLTGSASVDGGGFDLDGGVRNSVMQYNYSHDNDGSGFLAAQYPGAAPFFNNTIRYNISQNDGREHGHAGIKVWNGGNGIDNLQIYNNTVYLRPAATGSPSAVGILYNVSKVNFCNNTFVTTGRVRLINARQASGFSFRGNNYYAEDGRFRITWGSANHTTLSDWRDGTGQETLSGVPVGSNVDPLFVNAGGGGTIGNLRHLNTLTAYQLQSSSPLIQAGLDLFSLLGINQGSRDFYGNMTPQGEGFDVGAHEFNSSF